MALIWVTMPIVRCKFFFFYFSFYHINIGEFILIFRLIRKKYSLWATYPFIINNTFLTYNCAIIFNDNFIETSSCLLRNTCLSFAKVMILVDQKKHNRHHYGSHHEKEIINGFCIRSCTFYGSKKESYR